MDPLLNFLRSLGEIAKLFDDALYIVYRSSRIAIAQRVDPQYAVTLCQSLHDVFLAQGIAIPIVAETNDVLSFNHMYL